MTLKNCLYLTLSCHNLRTVNNILMKDLHVFNYKVPNSSEMNRDKCIVHLTGNGEGTHK